MAKKVRRKKARQNPPTSGSRKPSKARYTPGEIAMAVLGGLLLIMAAGIIITSILD
jgi:hypothetical protein